MRIKNYLSWTQINTLETSEKQYVKLYLEGQKLPINRGMALGSEIADALETGRHTGDIIKDFVVATLPRLDVQEKELRAKINIDGQNIPLLSFIDMASHDLTKIKEIKTGATAWNQRKVDQHGQITFYCVVIKAITGYIPEDIELVWAPSELINDKPELTGEIKRFKTKRSAVDVLKMKSRILKAWQRIEELTNEKFI